MRVGRLLGVVVALVGLGVGSLPGTALAAVPSAAAVQGTWGVNGTVKATTIVGNTVVVGGTFTKAVAPNGASAARVNLAAFSLSTGELLTGWRADTNGAVSALGNDGTSVFVGGTFTTVGGVAKAKLAKLDAGSGAVDAVFKPRVGGAVKAVEVAGSALYVGGSFSTRIAKLDAATGAAVSGFAASADKPVYSLALYANTLYVGGSFTALNGAPRLGLAALDATTGTVSGTVFTRTSVPMFGLDVSSDGTTLYGAQQSNQLTAWTTSNGARKFLVEVDGNAQAVKYFDGMVYFGFHDGYKGNTNLKLLAVNPTTGAVDPDFRPSIDSFYGVWAIEASSGGLVIGGAFTTVNGNRADRVAIFR